MRGALAHPIAEDDIAALLAPWLTREGRTSFYRQFAQADEAFTDAFAPMLDQIRCPVTVLWGEDDPWIPVARGEALAARIGVPLTRLAGLGHLPQLEAPDRVAEALLGALATQTEAA
jgi:pimeloyl-ACP methyl ester carboxylesterase